MYSAFSSNFCYMIVNVFLEHFYREPKKEKKEAEITSTVCGPTSFTILLRQYNQTCNIACNIVCTKINATQWRKKSLSKGIHIESNKILYTFPGYWFTWGFYPNCFPHQTILRQSVNLILLFSLPISNFIFRSSDCTAFSGSAWYAKEHIVIHFYENYLMKDEILQVIFSDIILSVYHTKEKISDQVWRS